MDTERIAGECRTLADAYVEAMRAQGKEAAHQPYADPKAYAKATEAWNRLLSASTFLGAGDIGRQIQHDALIRGSAASIRAQADELARLVVS